MPKDTTFTYSAPLPQFSTNGAVDLTFVSIDTAGNLSIDLSAVVSKNQNEEYSINSSVEFNTAPAFTYANVFSNTDSLTLPGMIDKNLYKLDSFTE